MKNSIEFLRIKWEILELSEEDDEPLYGFLWRIQALYPSMNISEKYTYLWEALIELSDDKFIVFCKFKNNILVQIHRDDILNDLNSPYNWTHCLDREKQILVQVTSSGIIEDAKLYERIKTQL